MDMEAQGHEVTPKLEGEASPDPRGRPGRRGADSHPTGTVRRATERPGWTTKVAGSFESFVRDFSLPLCLLGLIAWKIPGLALIIGVLLFEAIFWHSRWIEPLSWTLFVIIGFALRPWGDEAQGMDAFSQWSGHWLVYLLTGCFGYAAFRTREGKDFPTQLGWAVMLVIPTFMAYLLTGWPELNYYCSWDPWMRAWESLTGH